MKKQLAVFVLPLFTVFLICSCSSNNTDKTDPPKNEENTTPPKDEDNTPPPNNNDNNNTGSTPILDELITNDNWETLFPNRYGKPTSAVNAGKGDFYSYDAFIQAAKLMANIKVLTKRNCGTNYYQITRINKTTNESKIIRQDASFNSNAAGIISSEIDYADFVASKDLTIAKRELAAFLANISHETTGGWDTAPGGRESWGLVFNEEVGYSNGGTVGYIDANSQEYPPVAGKSYHGRGPIQLSWNYNYGAVSEFIYGDKNILLNNPEKLTESGIEAFKTAIWFWMTEQSPKPSCHDVITGKWIPSAADIPKNRNNGFGMTINIINGGVECGASNESKAKQREDRILFYKRYASVFSTTIDATTCDCNTMTSYYNEYPAACN